MAPATAFSSSGLGLYSRSRAVPGAAVRVATPRPAFLRIPAARAPAPAPASAPLLCFRSHADYFAPLKVGAPSADVNVAPSPAADENADSPAAAVIEYMMGGMFRPLRDNFHQLRSLKTVCDTEDYHIGMPYGALFTCIACYQLWKMDPSTFMDAALGYAFYKLSVLSSRARKQGLSNDFFARIKFVLVVIWVVKDFHRSTSLDYIRYPVWYIYLTTFLFDVCGVKKDAKGVFSKWYADLQTKEGILKLAPSLPRLRDNPYLD